jgi:hypothetical protein
LNASLRPILRRVQQRTLMIKDVAQITAIDPSRHRRGNEVQPLPSRRNTHDFAVDRAGAHLEVVHGLDHKE